MTRIDSRPWRERLRCFFGKHVEAQRTFGPYPYPDAYNCLGCGRLLYMVDEYATLNGVKARPRYANLDQWLEERG